MLYECIVKHSTGFIITKVANATLLLTVKWG